jgi:hypothetical protein
MHCIDPWPYYNTYWPWPYYDTYWPNLPPALSSVREPWRVVGYCPKCGLPIWAYVSPVTYSDHPPTSRHSCDCFPKSTAPEGKPAGLEHRAENREHCA